MWCPGVAHKTHCCLVLPIVIFSHLVVTWMKAAISSCSYLEHFTGECTILLGGALRLQAVKPLAGCYYTSIHQP